MTATTHFADAILPHGLRLRYREQGARDGSAALFLHGYTDSSFSFSGILPLLPPEWRVIVPDQRGHGDSDQPAEGYALDNFAQDALQLLTELGVSRAVVVGHSMGSLVAQRMAALHPERVASLVLVGSGHTARNGPVRELAGDVAKLTDPVDPAFVRDFQVSMVRQPVPGEFMERVIAESRKLPARVWQAAMAGMLQAGSTVELGSIRCPTHVIWGDEDGVFSRAEQDELVRRIPGATLTIFPGVGHSPHWEMPESFVRTLPGLAVA